MTQEIDNKKAKRRLDHNRGIIDRMNSGEPLWAFDSKSSWLPPRPTIEKDPKAIGQLYGTGVNGTQLKVESSGRGQESSESKQESGGAKRLKSVRRTERRDASQNSPTAD